MKKHILLLALLALSACSRNPDPEYAPERDDDDDAPAAQAPAAVTPAPAATPDPATPAGRLSDEEAYRLGREAAALLFADDIEALFERFDANVQGQAQNAANFRGMVSSVFAQTGAEGTLVEEAIESDPSNPEMAIYRRRGNYLAIGQDLNLLVALNADGTIAGINIQPAQ